MLGIKHQAKIVRINPKDSKIRQDHIGIAKGALEALNEDTCLSKHHVRSNTLFWLKPLYKMNFSRHPGLKLYGQFGVRRKATDKEINRLNKRMKATKEMLGWDELRNFIKKNKGYRLRRSGNNSS